MDSPKNINDESDSEPYIDMNEDTLWYKGKFEAPCRCKLCNKSMYLIIRDTEYASISRIISCGDTCTEKSRKVLNKLDTSRDDVYCGKCEDPTNYCSENDLLDAFRDISFIEDEDIKFSIKNISIKCEPSCNGQCLDSIFVKYCEDYFIRPNKCYECNIDRSIYIGNSSFDNFINRSYHRKKSILHPHICEEWRMNTKQRNCKDCNEYILGLSFRNPEEFGYGIINCQKEIKHCGGKCLSEFAMTWIKSYDQKSASKV